MLQQNQETSATMQLSPNINIYGEKSTYDAKCKNVPEN